MKAVYRSSARLFTRKSLPWILACVLVLNVGYSFVRLLLVHDRHYSRTDLSALRDVTLNTEVCGHVIIEPDMTMITQRTVLVFVQSSPLHAWKRYLIRKTWANRANYNRSKIAGLNFTVIFTLGAEYVGKPEGWSDIQNEIVAHRDILLLSLRDEYEMLVLKAWYTLRWIVRRLPHVEYVIKTDDDVLLNMHAWLSVAELLLKQSASCCIVGFVWIHPKVGRGMHKHAVTEKYYPYSNFPSFCSGLGYLMTRTAIEAILEASSHMPLFVLDDPYFTGFTAYASNVPLVTVPQSAVIIYHGSDGEVGDALLDVPLAVHNPSTQFWLLLWEQITMDNSYGSSQRQLQLTSLLDRDRILPYIKHKFQLNYNSTLKDECANSRPIPGSSLVVKL